MPHLPGYNVWLWEALHFFTSAKLCDALSYGLHVQHLHGAVEIFSHILHYFCILHFCLRCIQKLIMEHIY